MSETQHPYQTFHLPKLQLSNCPSKPKSKDHLGRTIPLMITVSSYYSKVPSRAVVWSFEADLHKRLRFTTGAVLQAQPLTPPQRQPCPALTTSPSLILILSLTRQHKQEGKEHHPPPNKKPSQEQNHNQTPSYYPRTPKVVLLLWWGLRRPSSDHTSWKLQNLQLYHQPTMKTSKQK